MNGAHLHLMINHVPVVGMLFVIVLIALALVRRSDELARVGLGMQVGVALSALAAFGTGEGAEEIVAKLPGVSGVLIERHQAAALTSLVSAMILGAIALAGLVFYRRPKTLPAWLVAAAFVLSLVVGGLFGWTANEGRKIRHTEIRAAFGEGVRDAITSGRSEVGSRGTRSPGPA